MARDWPLFLQLDRRLRDPLALGLHASLLVATLAIVALTVWRP